MKYIVSTLLVGAWLGFGTTLSAQPPAAPHVTLGVTAGGGGAQLWDDETRLGSGPLITGGVVVGLGDHLLLSGSADLSQHKRSLTYLAADGHVASGFARLTFLMGSSDARVRPIVGAGLGVLRSTGTLKTPSFPTSGPSLTPPVLSVETPWAVTRPAWDIHGGVRVGLAPRLVVQPEVRWRSTFGSAGNTSGIEPPLLGVQGLVSL
ncbi:MAG: hypothetical protein ABMA15_25095, partial [Vicinamibacterales bacterium]